MWLFTVYGFFSVVQSAEKKKGQKGPMMMIRGRDADEMYCLRSAFPFLKKYRTAINDGTDYKYRIVISKADWIKLSAELAKEIDYPNFKDEAAKVDASPGYCHRLMQMWALIRKVYGVVDPVQFHEPIERTAVIPEEDPLDYGNAVRDLREI